LPLTVRSSSAAVTPLSAWFLMVLGVIAVPIALFSSAYFSHAVIASRTAGVGIAFNLLLGSVEAVFVSTSVIPVLCAWEVMTLATAALVITDHQERATRLAAYLYLVMSHVGTGCLMAGFLVLAACRSTSFPSMLAGSVAQDRCEMACSCSSSWASA
jgi:hydrogenase-4 component B